MSTIPPVTSQRVSSSHQDTRVHPSKVGGVSSVHEGSSHSTSKTSLFRAGLGLSQGPLAPQMMKAMTSLSAQDSPNFWALCVDSMAKHIVKKVVNMGDFPAAPKNDAAGHASKPATKEVLNEWFNKASAFADKIINELPITDKNTLRNSVTRELSLIRDDAHSETLGRWQQKANGRLDSAMARNLTNMSTNLPDTANDDHKALYREAMNSFKMKENEWTSGSQKAEETKKQAQLLASMLAAKETQSKEEDDPIVDELSGVDAAQNVAGISADTSDGGEEYSSSDGNDNDDDEDAGREGDPLPISKNYTYQNIPVPLYVEYDYICSVASVISQAEPMYLIVFVGIDRLNLYDRMLLQYVADFDQQNNILSDYGSILSILGNLSGGLQDTDTINRNTLINQTVTLKGRPTWNPTDQGKTVSLAAALCDYALADGITFTGSDGSTILPFCDSQHKPSTDANLSLTGAQARAILSTLNSRNEQASTLAQTQIFRLQDLSGQRSACTDLITTVAKRNADMNSRIIQAF